MKKYDKSPVSTVTSNRTDIHSFLDNIHNNIDLKTVKSFGDEWEKFDSFSDEEIEKIGNDYFDIVPWASLGSSATALDVGCGTGRWAKYLSSRISFIEAIDPSNAAMVATEFLKENDNVRVSIADVDRIPFQDDSFDLVYSLGVLHHIPDTNKALVKCVKKVKQGGFFLVYLYYSLDNRGVIYKLIFRLSNLLRMIISNLPSKGKSFICELMAIFVYKPLIFISHVFDKIGMQSIADKIPLAYYKRASWNIIRNDALDRFGTPLEQRFSKSEIESMMHNAGLKNIVFSDQQPYWHVIGQKK